MKSLYNYGNGINIYALVNLEKKVLDNVILKIKMEGSFKTYIYHKHCSKLTCSCSCSHLCHIPQKYHSPHSQVCSPNHSSRTDQQRLKQMDSLFFAPLLSKFDFVTYKFIEMYVLTSHRLRTCIKIPNEKYHYPLLKNRVNSEKICL